MRIAMRMAVTVLAAALAAASSSAAAGWVRLSANEYYTAYASDISVPKPGGVVEMWTLNDYSAMRKSRSGRPYMSKKMQGEYDCAKRQSRIIWATTHDEPMGGGSIRTTYTQAEAWQSAPAGSFEGYVLDRACSAAQRPSILSK
jgi:hypothetical protein